MRYWRFRGVLVIFADVYVICFVLLMSMSQRWLSPVQTDRLFAIVTPIHVFVAALFMFLILACSVNVIRRDDVTAMGKVAWVGGFIFFGLVSLPLYHFRFWRTT